MRGDVYRLGRRRAGSIVLAAVAAAALAGGTPGAAGARPATAVAKLVVRGAAHTPVKPPSPMAHATGHKIA
jgi:hypothetical protein